MLKNEKKVTMSFYLMLSSDGSRDTFPANHGGDFKVQLDHTLDMRSEPWEVALVEMMYTGQAFPNISSEDSLITLKMSGKPQFENDYFITYDAALDLWLSFKTEKFMGVGAKRETVKNVKIDLPRQHYTWESFVETLTRLCYDTFSMNGVFLTKEEFQFREANMDLGTIFNMSMSDDFRKLFGIADKYKQVHDHVNRLVSFKHPVTKMPQIIEDKSLVFYSPFNKYTDCKMSIGNEGIFSLTPQYWTIKMFRRAIDALSKNFTSSSWLTSMHTEVSDENQLTLVLTPNQTWKRSDVYVANTDDLTKVLGIEHEYPILYTEELRIKLKFHPSDDVQREWGTFEASKYLKNNYYPTLSFIIDELNETLTGLMLDIGKQRKNSSKPFTFFSHRNEIVTFTGKEGSKVLLGTGLLKLLHLPIAELDKSVTATSAVELKPYNRTHLFVHLDCLDYHYVNSNVSDLIRVVPNAAALEERMQLSFPDPRYYAVAKRYMSTINMYVTDSYFERILLFNNDIAYTLHFRKCLHSS